MTEVRLPKTGDAVEEGTLVQWLVENGARVERGAPLYLLETDKVEMEIEAPCAGVVSHVGTAGEVYRVGELIATIAEDHG
jgi:2-oxoglutarate dehydrogenase E2 component (dihydrolipoamide succinyltransferase)